MSDSGVTRRELLRRGALAGAALALPSIFTACGGASAGARRGTDPKEFAHRLTISNWPFYIDVDDETKRRPTLERFTRETGIEVDYIEDVNSNEEFFESVRPRLERGAGIGRDLVVLTDWMAARMVRLGFVERTDKAAIPNEVNLVEGLASPEWDPKREYSLPWQSGLTGIGYDPNRTGRELSSVEDLFDPKLKGKVTFLSELADTMGLMLLDQGADPSSVDPKEFDRALARLQKGVESGQILQFTGNDYASLLERGDIWAAVAWSGDMVQLGFSNPELRFVVPDAGGIIWTENMLIPNRGDVGTASTFMNFVYDPEIAAQIAAYVNYICPVLGAQEAIAAIDPALAENTLIFPTPDTLQNVHAFDTRAIDEERFKRKFRAVAGV